MGFIYKISNNFDNKLYIGLTTKKDARGRWYQHRYLARHLSSSDKSYLHHAMHEHGVENFTFEVIEEIEDDKLPQREQYWIEQYNAYAPNGYNLTLGGEGTPGFRRPQSEEERQRKGESLKKFFAEHPEAVEISRQRMIENNKDPEFRKKALEGSRRYREEHPNCFSGENNPFYGKHHTEESLKKIRAAAAKRQIPIQQLDKDTGEVIATYPGIKAAEAALKIPHGRISPAARENRIAYGYKWRILESVTTNSNSEISAE